MKTQKLFGISILLLICVTANIAQPQQRRFQNSSNEKLHMPAAKLTSLNKSFPVNGIEQKAPVNSQDLIPAIRSARKSGAREEVQRLQSELNRLSGAVTKRGENVGYIKKVGRHIEPGDNIDVSQIQNRSNNVSITTVTEQRGDNAGRIWAITINNLFGTSGAAGDYCETNFYFSDDDGVNWYYYAYAYNPYEAASLDEIDAEIIEDVTGTKYMYVVYGAYTNTSSKYICNLIALEISGNVIGYVTRLEFPGFDYFDNTVNYYKPRITSDNAFWSGAAYIYIAVCQDSANGMDYDFSEKVAMITNPYTTTPGIDYKPYYHWYFSNNNGFRQGCCDIAWFDDPNNGGGSVMLVESGAFFTTALYLYETTDVGFISGSTYEGFLDPDAITKSSAYIASNGLYENLMIVNVSEYSSTDYDIQYFSTVNAGVNWNTGYVSYTFDHDQRADITGMRNVQGNFHTAFADNNSSFNVVFYSTAVNNSWGPVVSPINILDASYECGPRPGLRLGGSDSCFAVWAENFLYTNVWASIGCDGSAEQVKSLDFAALIEGYYIPYHNMTRSDSVTVSLRESTPPYNVAESKKLILNPDGYMRVNYTEIDNTTGYYIVFNHRSSIETWSALPINFNFGTYYVYDFIYFDTQAYGNNLKYMGTDPFSVNYYSVYSGDVNQDGVIDATDLSLIDNDANNFVTGYVSTDVDGNDFVDASDAAITDNNAFNFVSVVSP